MFHSLSHLRVIFRRLWLLATAADWDNSYVGSILAGLGSGFFVFLF